MTKTKTGEKTSKGNLIPTVEPSSREFEVDEILEHHRSRSAGLKYHVSWVGYHKSESSWEPEAALHSAPQKVTQYWKKASKDKRWERTGVRSEKKIKTTSKKKSSSTLPVRASISTTATKRKLRSSVASSKL